MSEKSTKSRFELKLSDEKRAYVVIALTNKLSRAGKAAAATALAHYDSRKGFAYASVETMAREAGYAPSSTKTMSRGLAEIHDVGAFKVLRTKGGASNTHHVCPNMAWFRAEYEHLRGSSKVGEDEFADIREEKKISESQFGINLGSPHEEPGSVLHNPGLESGNSGSELNNPSPEPDEEGSMKRASEEDQRKRTNSKGAASCRGPAVGLIVDNDAQRQKRANDNIDPHNADHGARVSQWPVDMYRKFMDIYPKGGDPEKVKSELDRIEREGTDYRIILKGASNYKREKVGTAPQWLSDPVNFLRKGVFLGYQKEPPSVYRKMYAI